MATAQYQKERVASAARQRIAKTIEDRNRLDEIKAEKREKRIAEKMEPRWWRLRKMTRERAELEIANENISWMSSPFMPYLLEVSPDWAADMEKSLRIAKLAEGADGTLVTLTHDEANFLFANAQG